MSTRVGAVEWHGERAYAWCADCGSLVQINKRVFGAMHLCVNECVRRGHHSQFALHRRVGPFWRRRDEYRCADCGTVIEPRAPRLVTK